MSGGVKIAENPLTGVSTWIYPDPDNDDGVIIQEQQDVAALLDENTALRNIAADGWKGDYHSIARIPLAMAHDPNAAIHHAMREGDDKWVSKFLNDSDNGKLRTKGGNV